MADPEHDDRGRGDERTGGVSISSEPVRVITALFRGIRKRCPHCGRGRLFNGWYSPRLYCVNCGLSFDRLQDNTWAAMYMTTAGLTGVIVVGMFVIRPVSIAVGQVVLFPLALLVIVGSLPRRKGLAMALEFAVEQRWGSLSAGSADHSKKRPPDGSPAQRP